MHPGDVALLCVGGFAAGVVNALAGGGSLLTVPLLVLVGLPGTLANGTNRIGVLVQNISSARRFGVEGVPGVRRALPLLAPVILGAAVGAVAIAQVTDRTFDRIFACLMILLLVPVLAGSRLSARTTHRPLSPAVTWLMFFAIGLYGGAVQAGVGILLVFALSYTGNDLVRANSIKVVVIGVLTLTAIPVFVAHHQIAWLPAAVLALGFAAGGAYGARLAVRGGERIIRPVLAVSVLALAGRMFGLY